MSFSIDAHNCLMFLLWSLGFLLQAQRHHPGRGRARGEAPDSAFLPGTVGLAFNALSWIESGEGSDPLYYWTFMRMKECFDALMLLMSISNQHMNGCTKNEKWKDR